jgi:hypothetical protein
MKKEKLLKELNQMLLNGEIIIGDIRGKYGAVIATGDLDSKGNTTILSACMNGSSLQITIDKVKKEK